MKNKNKFIIALLLSIIILLLGVRLYLYSISDRYKLSRLLSEYHRSDKEYETKKSIYDDILDYLGMDVKKSHKREKEDILKDIASIDRKSLPSMYYVYNNDIYALITYPDILPDGWCLASMLASADVRYYLVKVNLDHSITHIYIIKTREDSIMLCDVNHDGVNELIFGKNGANDMERYGFVDPTKSPHGENKTNLITSVLIPQTIEPFPLEKETVVYTLGSKPEEVLRTRNVIVINNDDLSNIIIIPTTRGIEIMPGDIEVHSCWGDLYGNRLPVLCEIAIPKIDEKLGYEDKRDKRQRLRGYWKWNPTELRFDHVTITEKIVGTSAKINPDEFKGVLKKSSSQPVVPGENTTTSTKPSE